MDAQPQNGMESEEAKKGGRICDFYLTPRGCIKAEACDFAHPVAPSGGASNKVCDFFLKPRGCVKGKDCDFLHPDLAANPRLPQMVQSTKVCTFFVSPRGCVKGNGCDFFHPGPQGMGGPQMGMGGPGGFGMQGGMQQGMQGGMQQGQNAKMCDFFMTPRGCAKGNTCNFSHGQGGMAGQGGFGMPPQMGRGGPMGGRGMAMPKKPKLCDFFASERGCVKGDACDFIHQKDKPCDFFNTEAGCRKGELCDFKHASGDGDESQGSGKVAKATGAQRFTPY